MPLRTHFGSMNVQEHRADDAKEQDGDDGDADGDTYDSIDDSDDNADDEDYIEDRDDAQGQAIREKGEAMTKVSGRRG